MTRSAAGRGRSKLAAQRQPVEVHREQQLQHDGEPEGRHRDARHRNDAQHVVGPAVVVDGGDDAERHADQRREQQRGRSQLERRRQALADVERHRPAREGALAEVEARHLAEIDDELLSDRPVEAVLLAQIAAICCGRRVFAGQRRGRIGRHHADQQEGQDQQPQQRREDEQRRAAGRSEACGASSVPAAGSTQRISQPLADRCRSGGP